MKLNPDCIRAILLTVEDACSMERTIILPQDRGDYLKPYFDEEILYHVRQCNLSGLLYKATAVSGAGKTNYIIMDLSPAGHAFLANVRKELRKFSIALTCAQVNALCTFSFAKCKFFLASCPAMC